MPRQRVMTLGVLNITIHPPHDAIRYVDLLESAISLLKLDYEQKNFLHIHSKYYCLIEDIVSIDNNSKEEGLLGTIYRFFDISKVLKWININTRKRLYKKDIKNDVVIPDHLKPDLHENRFIFYPKTHRLVFISQHRDGNLSPDFAQKLFERLFSKEEIINKFGHVKVIQEQSKDTLDRVFGLSRLEKLKINVSLPNGDDYNEWEERLRRKWEQENVSDLHYEIRSPEKASLNPTDETVALANIALSNGTVNAEGIDQEGKKAIISTSAHPVLKKFYYDADTGELNALKTFSLKLLEELANQKRNI